MEIKIHDYDDPPDFSNNISIVTNDNPCLVEIVDRNGKALAVSVEECYRAFKLLFEKMNDEMR